MIFRTVVLLAAAVVTCFSSCPALCSDWVMPGQGDRIEILLDTGEVFPGVLLEVTADHLLIRPYGVLPGEESILRSGIVGIRRPGESTFHSLTGKALPMNDPMTVPPTTIRVRVYDKLPLMGVAIIGGVFAGHRFGEASSERDLASELEKLGHLGAAEDLKSNANKHEDQAWIGVLIGAVALIYASIPSFEETTLPVTAKHDADLTSFEVGIDLTRMVKN